MAKAGSNDDARQSDSALPDRRTKVCDARKEPIILNESIDSLSISLSSDVEALASELRSRWEQGNHATVESLGERFERVARNDEQLLDLIYHEVLLREEHGEAPGLSDYAARFPNHVERLERLFAVHDALEVDWPDDDVIDGRSAGKSIGDRQPDDCEPLGLSENSDNPDRDASRQWPRKSQNQYPVDPPPGYEMLEELGRGGMAVVFRARQQILNRIVAIKMLQGGGIASKEVLARIQQEARAVAQLQHPGIVQIYEVGEHRGLPFLSLEYVPGGTLQEWLSGQPLAPLEACRIGEQLARIIHYAHERGIVHRDLKPANVLLAERPETDATGRARVSDLSRSGSSSSSSNFGSCGVKIGDFGLARVLDHGSDLTATGQIIGTPSYMAPEQAAGFSGEAAPTLDIYSLGAILFELLTGRPPFKGATLYDTLEQVRTDEPVPPRRLQPRVPKDLETVCLKCLEKTPARRYSTALALAEDLRAVQLGESIRARPIGQIERFGKWVRRFPAIASLLLLSLLVTIGGVTGILIANRNANLQRIDAVLQRERAVRFSNNAEKQRDEANRLRSIAEVQTKKAEFEKRSAETARTEAVVARMEAESSLKQALDAIDVLSRLGVELRNAPMQEATSQRILDETLSLYDKLEKNHGDNPRLRDQLATTLIRAGEIRFALRDTEKAGVLLKRAVDLLDEEQKRRPDDLALLKLASSANWHRGVFFNSTSRPSEALASLEKCLAAEESILRATPDDHSRMIGKANCLTNICASLSSLRRYEETLPHFHAAIEILSSISAKFPANNDAARELAMTLHDYSRVSRILNRTIESDAALNEALEIHKNILKRSPDDLGNRHLFARLCIARGTTFRQAGDHAQSLAQFQLAEEMLEPLTKRLPNVFDYQRDRILAIANQVEACMSANDAVNGKQQWNKLTERLIEARKKFPTDQWVAGQLHNWGSSQADELWESGQTEEAKSLLRHVIESARWLSQQEQDSTGEPLTPQVLARNANAAAWYLTIIPEPKLREVSLAVSLANRAVEFAPQDSNFLHTLGVAQYYSGDYRAAFKSFKRAVEMETVSSVPSSEQNTNENATSEPPDDSAKLVAALNPDHAKRNPLLYSMLAMTQWQLGDHNQASVTFQMVPKPDNAFTRSGAQDRRLIAEAKALIEQ